MYRHLWANRQSPCTSGSIKGAHPNGRGPMIFYAQISPLTFRSHRSRFILKSPEHGLGINTGKI